MQPKVEIKERMTYVCVAGSINSVNAQQFGDVLSVAPDETEAVNISSAGFRLILKTQKALQSKDELKLTHVPQAVREVFDITGFSDFLMMA